MREKSLRGRRGASADHFGAFPCEHCGAIVPSEASGTKHRNHCPNCLWSLHVDLRTGDRRSGCRAPMRPIGIEVRYNGEWALIHRCEACGLIRANRIAGDDNPAMLLALAARPMARPPFPIEGMAFALRDGKEADR